MSDKSMGGYAKDFVWSERDFDGCFTASVVLDRACEYCGSRAPSDERGNCGACGAPRPVVVSMGRPVILPDHLSLVLGDGAGRPVAELPEREYYKEYGI